MPLCIVGKNNIAIECAAYAMASGLVDKEDLFIMPASSDLGEDEFQTFLVNSCRKKLEGRKEI